MLNFDWLAGIDISVARFFLLFPFVAACIFSFLLKKEYIYKGAKSMSIFRNLKVWIFLMTVVMVTTYLYF